MAQAIGRARASAGKSERKLGRASGRSAEVECGGGEG